MNTKATSLQAKIIALNNLNNFTFDIVQHETSELKKYLNQNIFKVDGSFKAKVVHSKLEIKDEKTTLNGYNWNVSIRYYHSIEYGKLNLNITVCTSGGGSDINNVSSHCIYEKSRVSIYNVKDGVLLPLDCEQYVKQANFDESEILKAAENVRLAAIEYNKVLNSVPYEFRNVLYLERLTR